MASSLKILVAYHKPAALINNDIFVPIHVGRSGALISETIGKDDLNWLLENTIGDDTGENISSKNNRYNELTAIYWAWKNYEQLGNPQYIGLAHYRRHLIFNNYQQPLNGRWTIDINEHNSDYVRLLNMTEESMATYLSKYDCLYSEYIADYSVYDQFKKSENHHIEDLDFILSIIEKEYPRYYSSALKYVQGKNHFFGNMFILKKNYFFEYCSFIFDILGKLEESQDISDFSIDEQRFYCSERITGMFIQYLIDSGIGSRPLNSTFIINPECKRTISPYFPENNIPIAFALDDNYAPYFSVTLRSLLDNASTNYNYDIVILYEHLSARNRDNLEYMCHGKKNVHIRFVNVSPYFSQIDDEPWYIEIHVSKATYYRFLLPDIFSGYEKILYLDSDLCILKDISELYNIDIGNCWVGAALDIRESIPTRYNHVRSKKGWRDYLIDTLHLEDPYQYFQAGVLIINIDECIRNNVKDRLIERLREVKTPFLSDQDILNSVCYNHTYFFPANWNIEWQIIFEFPSYQKYLSETFYKAYTCALKDKAIIHYASRRKPWNFKALNDHFWWKYARKTPFYEDLLTTNTINKARESSSLKKVIYVADHILYFQFKKMEYRLKKHIYSGRKKEIYRTRYKTIKRLLREARKYKKESVQHCIYN